MRARTRQQVLVQSAWYTRLIEDCNKLDLNGFIPICLLVFLLFLKSYVPQGARIESTVLGFIGI